MPCAHSLQHSKVEHWSNLTHGALWKKHNLPSSKITTYWPFVLSFFWNDHLWSYQFTIFWGKASHSCSSKDTFENPLQDKRQWCSCSSRAPSVWKRETDLEGCFMSCSWNPAWEEGLCAGAAPAGALPPALCEHMDGEPGSRRGLGHAGGRACGSGPIAPPPHSRSTGWHGVHVYPQPLSAQVAFHGPKTVCSGEGGLCQVSSADQNCLHHASINTQANLSPSDVLCEGFIITPLLTWAPSETQTAEGVCDKWCIQGERRMEKSGAFLGATPTVITFETVMTAAKLPSCSSFNLSLLFFFKLKFFSMALLMYNFHKSGLNLFKAKF